MHIFFRRLVAYLLDAIIVSFIFSLITVNYSNSRLEIYRDEMNKLSESYIEKKIDTSEYVSKYEGIVFDIEKASVYINVVYLVVCVGYFVIFQFLNSGQTIGKKIMKIRIVGDGNINASLLQIIIRSSIIDGIIFYIMSLLLVLVTNKDMFFIGYSIINFVSNMILIASAIMIICRSDNKGLQDVLSRSYIKREE